MPPAKHLISTAVISLLLSACATPAPVEQAVSAAAVISQTGELPPQTLAPDSCGLFLWTQTEPRRFVFFNEASQETALMKIKDVESELTRTGNGGDIFGQFMTRMTYAYSDGTVAMQIEPGDKLDGGQRIDSGRLVLTSKEGWETIVPVLGLRACQQAKR